MSIFLKNGNTYRVTSKEAMDLQDQLPAGNYVIKKDPFNNFYLETVDPFEINHKLYGKTARHTQRILHTFMDRENSTGVMLTGEKGSGKTLLAKNISYQAARQGIPTIIINAPWCGDDFNSFIQNIGQHVIILFDEFEKVYDKDDQQQILTLLDGVFPSKKLFMLTCNDKWRIDEHMRNRPGRIFYMLDFKGLDEEFIREYCEDNLEAKHYIGQICKIASMFDQFNFDMLKALVEDMNRFNESPQECLEMLNAKPEFSNDIKFKVDLVVNGEEIDSEQLDDKEWFGNPLQKGVRVSYYNKNLADDNYDGYCVEKFASSDLLHIDSKGGKFTLVNDNNARLTLSRVAEKSFNYNWAAF